MERSGTARQPQLLGQKKDKFWLTVGLCALTAALFFLPFYIIDGGFFHYAGDFNSQQISFYRYMNGFIKGAGYPDSTFTSVHNTFSWATDLGSGVDMDVRTVRLLPLEDEHFAKEETGEKPIRFEPSAEEVLARVMPAYITGFLYSAMVDSFCAEQNARASAMDSANQNEDDMLRELQLEYNHERQGTITSEITEVSAGARSKKNHMKKEAQHAHR